MDSVLFEIQMSHSGQRKKQDIQVKYTKIGRSLFMKWQPESWHIQYSHCFFLCHKFSDPFFFPGWLIHQLFLSLWQRQISFGRKTIFPPPHFLWDREEHQFIALTKLATWTERPIALRTEVQDYTVLWQNCLRNTLFATSAAFTIGPLSIIQQ